AELLATSLKATSRDADAAQGLEEHARFEAPTAGYHEKAYFHDLAADAEGFTQTAVVNRDLGHGVYVRFSREALPYYTEWKMMGQRNYVAGMEPANALPLGRATERREGRLHYLDPGQ